MSFGGEGHAPGRAKADERSQRRGGGGGGGGPDEPSQRRGVGVGVVVPYDFALDREIWRWVPDEVDLFVTRTPNLPLRADVEMARRISCDEAVRAGTRDVLAVEPDVVLYLCTSGSFVRGVAGEHRIREVMR